MKRCPETHTAAPENYVAWHECAERKSRTHEQHQCSECGRWSIWKPKRHAPGTAS